MAVSVISAWWRTAWTSSRPPSTKMQRLERRPAHVHLLPRSAPDVPMTTEIIVTSSLRSRIAHGRGLSRLQPELRLGPRTQPSTQSPRSPGQSRTEKPRCHRRLHSREITIVAHQDTSTGSCPDQRYILAVIARYLSPCPEPYKRRICRQVGECSSVCHICLKIVVSPVRVRVSPYEKCLQDSGLRRTRCSAHEWPERSRLPFPAFSALGKPKCWFREADPPEIPSSLPHPAQSSARASEPKCWDTLWLGKHWLEATYSCGQV
jgi:hypothetical protein